MNQGAILGVCVRFLGSGRAHAVRAPARVPPLTGAFGGARAALKAAPCGARHGKVKPLVPPSRGLVPALDQKL